MHKYIIIAALFVPLFAQSQYMPSDPTFNPYDIGFGNLDGFIYPNNESHVIELQPDGKLLVGGKYGPEDPCLRKGMARLLTDGSIDHAFTAALGTGFDGEVYDIKVQADGKILVAGSFTSLNGMQAKFVTRLEASGLSDPFFNTDPGFNNRVERLVVQPDGRILAGGAFTQVNGTSQNRLARLFSDGNHDNSLALPTGGFNNDVLDMALQADGKIVVVGRFTAIGPNVRHGFCRLEPNGTFDPSLSPPLFSPSTGNEEIRAVLLTANYIFILGKFSFGGFSSFEHLDRMAYNGAVYPGSGSNNTSKYGRRMLIDANGMLLVPGLEYIQRIDPTTAGHDTAFEQEQRDWFWMAGILSSGALANFSDLALRPDGRIAVLQGRYYVKFHFGQLLPDGKMDETFHPGYGLAASPHHAGSLPVPPSIDHTEFAISHTGELFFGGMLFGFNGVHRPVAVKTDAVGVIDPVFKVQPSTSAVHWGNYLSDVHVDLDNKLYVAGNGLSASVGGLFKLDDTGARDATFTVADMVPWGITTIRDVLVLSGGSMIVGGVMHWGLNLEIFKVFPDGTTDPSFTPIDLMQAGGGVYLDFDFPVRHLIPTPDGRVYAVGEFVSANGLTRGNIVRFLANGTIDPAFTTGASGFNAQVYDAALQNDGKIVCVGAFTSYNGVARNRIARLNPDGTLDLSFDPGDGANALVRTVVTLPSGAIVIGGDFDQYNLTLCAGIMGVNGSGDVDPWISFGTGFRNWNNTPGSVWQMELTAENQLVCMGNFVSYDGVGRNRIARIGVGTPTSLSLAISLAGAEAPGMLRDDLRVAGVIPLQQPFQQGFMGMEVRNESINPTVLQTTGPVAIVDWVLLQLCNKLDASDVVASRCVLLRRDGQVVDLDGFSSVAFPATADDYFVRIAHRNHLAVVTNSTYPMGGQTVHLDIASGTVPMYGNAVLQIVNGRHALWSGDVSGDGTVKYTGTGNDRDLILSTIGGVVPTNSVTGYLPEDVNMDAIVSYTGNNNDRDVILSNIGGVVPTNVITEQLP